MTQDPYLRPSGVLQNTFDLDDVATLARLEANAALRGAMVLFRRPGVVPATWDLDHVRGIHRLLFGSIYPWAGELRTIDVVKGTTRFANAEYLEDAAADTFRRLLDPSIRLRARDRMAMVARASALLAELNLLHPFREGNGRTQRAFLQLLVLEAGSVLRWDRITAEQNITASIHSVTDDDAFVDLFDQILEPADGVEVPPLNPRRPEGTEPPGRSR